MTVRTAWRAAPGRPREAWLRAVAWALLGVVLLGLAVAAGVPVRERVADEEAFQGARPCGSEAAAEDTADCLRTIRGTVLSAEPVKSGRVMVFRVRLRGPVPAPADRPLDLDTHGDLSERVKPGDEVEVTTWRNVQVAVGHDGRSETLPGLPDEKATMLVGLALACAWPAILAFIAAFRGAGRARCLAAGRPFAPRVAFGPAKCIGVVALPITVAILAGQVWDAWTAVATTVVIWAATALPATVAGMLWDRDEPRGTAD
ncbi:hypothetical protein [Streptomyces sp. NPDC056987]|uniref:hypothetical protein n=1 Tax=Streptomyces sp. NPDC056987 TaxID=3345988 RepID=UPI003637DED5